MKLKNSLLEKSRIFLDGAMGTMLQSMGLKGGECPEEWNVRHPERVIAIHRAYIEAGADIVTANTFGATREHLGDFAKEAMQAGVKLALQAVKQANKGYAFADIGSLGKLLEPYGDMQFEEAISQFKEVFKVALRAGANGIIIETMTDLLEIKASVIAAKESMEEENIEVPLFVTMTFDEKARLLSGADIEGTVAMLEGMGIDAIGVNCGHEPAKIIDNVKKLMNCATIPVLISPNASLPVVIDGKTHFKTTANLFAEDMKIFAKMGAWGLGGCCGTTPEHIKALCEAVKDIEIIDRVIANKTWISGRSKSICIEDKPLIVGERLNPTGKKMMKKALLENDMDYLLREAIFQVSSGADVLDVNVGLPEIDEVKTLQEVIRRVQTICEVPLQIDTSNTKALEKAMRCYQGKPIINSVCGKQKVMDEVFPLVKKYGGAVVALCLDDNGIPDTVEKRIEIADKIILEAKKYGINKNELLFDALTMTVATNDQAANITLECVEKLTKKSLKTILGVSNVSFGLPNRQLVNATMLSTAINKGLTAAIMNPCDALMKGIFDAGMAVSGKDKGFVNYIENHSNDSQLQLTSKGGNQRINNDVDSLKQAIIKGLTSECEMLANDALNNKIDPLELIEKEIMPALAQVGESYENGKLYLPQLLQSATAAQAAFERISQALPAKKEDEGVKVILATVEGDVHDIGKNIVKVLLKNYGFTVIDLGKNVKPEEILKATIDNDASIVGLSALMTTTVPAMEKTIALLNKELPEVKVMVGGAVLSEEYANVIKANAYGKDAMSAVRIATKWKK